MNVISWRYLSFWWDKVALSVITLPVWLLNNTGMSCIIGRWHFRYNKFVYLWLPWQLYHVFGSVTAHVCIRSGWNMLYILSDFAIYLHFTFGSHLLSFISQYRTPWYALWISHQMYTRHNELRKMNYWLFLCLLQTSPPFLFTILELSNTAATCVAGKPYKK